MSKDKTPISLTRLFLDGYGSQSRERLGKLIASVKANNLLLPVTVIVPNTYAGLSLRRSLAKEKGLVNVRFMALPRLAEYLGAPALAAQGKSPLSPIMKLLAIRHFARDMTKKEPLAAIADHAPLHNYLIGTFTDLAMLFEDGLSTLENRSPILKQITEWYRLYRGLVSGYYDREELSKAAAETVTTGKASGALKDLGFILFYLVTNFSPGESALISALGNNKLCAVILGLAGEEQADAATYKVAERLEPALGKAKVIVPEPCAHYADHIVVTPDAHEEVRYILRDIAKSIQQGIPFHRMAILYRNADPYASLVKTQLELAGIPMAGPNPLPIGDTPAGKLLACILEVFESDFSRESVMRWVSETPVRIGKDGEPVSIEITLWEAISSTAGIIKGAQQWKERLDNFCRVMQRKIDRSEIDENGEPIGAEYFEIRKASAARLKKFISGPVANPPPSDGASWKDYTDWSTGLMKKYTDHTWWPEDQSDNYDKVIAILDELAELDGIEPAGTDLSDFRQMLDDCLKASSGRAGPTGSGVFVAPVATVQGMEFDTVYIVGMAEGAFPPTLPDDAIIPDKYKTELGSDVLPLRANKRADERRIFKSVISTGQKRILSYPRSGSAGQRRGYPSPWLVSEAESLHRKIAEECPSKGASKPDIIVGSINLEEFAHEPWLSVVHSAQHSIESLSGLVPSDIHDYDMHSLAKWHMAGHQPARHFLMAEGSTGHRTVQIVRGRRGETFTAWDGNVSGLAGISALLGIPEDRQFSPTRLELWAKCPFHYYMRYVLEIPVIERPEEIVTISPLDRGSLVHEILERFMKTVNETKKELGVGEPWTPEHKKLLLEIADEEFTTVEAQGITGRPLLWKVAKQEVLEDLTFFLKMDSKLRAENLCQPVEIESKFGFKYKGCYPPVSLTTKDGHTINFSGIIDRVDADILRANLWVMDYKTGSSYPYKDIKEGSLLGAGKHLQLPVYAMAMRSRFGDGCTINASYWFVTAKGNFDMKTVPLAEVEKEFRDLVETIASGIEGGIFLANPGTGGEDHNNCAYCDYKRVCPAHSNLAWERKSRDPVLSGYVGMIKEEASEEVEA